MSNETRLKPIMTSFAACSASRMRVKSPTCSACFVCDVESNPKQPLLKQHAPLMKGAMALSTAHL
eukprot:scaffold27640_cov33-Tisochrysis_lutea.AAC.3